MNVSEDPLNSTILLGPDVQKNVGVNDGGTYTYLLDVLLRNKIPHKVTDSTLVRSKCIFLIFTNIYFIVFDLRASSKNKLINQLLQMCKSNKPIGR